MSKTFKITVPEPTHGTPIWNRLMENRKVDKRHLCKVSGIGILLLVSIITYIRYDAASKASKQLGQLSMRIELDPIEDTDSDETKRMKAEAIKWNHLNDQVQEISIERKRTSFVSEFSNSKSLQIMSLIGGLLIFVGETKGLVIKKERS